MIEPFLASFVLAFISEIADKTQLVVLGLALKYKSNLKVFSGALLAHAVMDGIAIAMGAFFGFSFPMQIIKNIIGLIFILLGLWILIESYAKKSKTGKREVFGKNPFAASFLFVLISEFGDKTQIASGLLAAEYLAPLQVFTGFVFALAIAISLNIFVGSKIAKRMPSQTMQIIAAVLFMLFGIFALFF